MRSEVRLLRLLSFSLSLPCLPVSVTLIYTFTSLVLDSVTSVY